MKTKLELAREIINDVDAKMIELFIKRMEAAKMVAELTEKYPLYRDYE